MKGVLIAGILTVISALSAPTDIRGEILKREAQGRENEGEDSGRSPYLIKDWRALKRPPGKIQTMNPIEKAKEFTRFYIVYHSGELKITGMMNIPNGKGPFPAVILNHGHYDPRKHVIGAGFKEAADIFARNGYLAAGSDYRNHGASSKGSNLFQHLGSLYDVLSLLDVVKEFPGVDKQKIGMWGYSGGGWLTLKTVVIDSIIRVAALFGPMSADDADNYYALSKWHPEDVKIINRVIGTPAGNPEGFAQMSPLNYVKEMPKFMIIHRGENDKVIPREWNERLRDELLHNGKVVEYYTYPGQGHVLTGKAWELSMQRTIAFFNKYMKSN